MTPTIHALAEIRAWLAKEECPQYRAAWASIAEAEAQEARFFVFVPAKQIEKARIGETEARNALRHRSRMEHPGSAEVDEVYGFADHASAQRFMGSVVPLTVQCTLYPLPGDITGEDMLLELEGHPESGYLRARVAGYRGSAKDRERAQWGGGGMLSRDDLAALHVFIGYVLARMPLRQ